MHINNNVKPYPQKALATKKAYAGPCGCGKGVTVALYTTFTILLVLGLAGLGVSIYYLVSLTSTSTTTSYILYAAIAVSGVLAIGSFVTVIILACNQALCRNDEAKNFNNQVHNSNLQVVDTMPNNRHRRNRGMSDESYNQHYDPYDDLDDDDEDLDRFNAYGANPKRSKTFYPAYDMANPYFQNNVNSYPMNDAFQAPIKSARAASMLERPVTVIKEIHHHHYGPDGEEKRATSKYRRNVAESPSLFINLKNSAKSIENNVETYQLDTRSGELKYMGEDGKPKMNKNKQKKLFGALKGLFVNRMNNDEDDDGSMNNARTQGPVPPLSQSYPPVQPIMMTPMQMAQMSGQLPAGKWVMMKNNMPALVQQNNNMQPVYMQRPMMPMQMPQNASSNQFLNFNSVPDNGQTFRM